MSTPRTPGPATIVIPARKARRAPDFTRFNPVMTAMFDAITNLGTTSSGWISVETAIIAGVVAVDPQTALKCGLRDHKPGANEDRIRLSGARNKARNDLMIAERRDRVEIVDKKVRLTSDFTGPWRGFRGMPATKPTKATKAQAVPRVTKNKDRILAGWIESEAWALAPLCQVDRIQFRSPFDLELADIRAALPAGVSVSVSPDGQYVVECAAGTGNTLRLTIDAWLESIDHPHDGVRVVLNLNRRDLTRLPVMFLSDLYKASFGPARSRLARSSSSSLRVLVPEQDDVNQLIGLWIMEAATQYDAERGVPFGGFLARKLPHWVQDINRSAHGRTAAEDELRLRRATAAFTTAHNREPTDQELADALGQSLSTTRKKALNVATLQGMRQVKPLLGPDEGGYEPVSDHDTEAAILSDEYYTLLSQSLVEGTLGEGAENNPLGLIAAYFTTYGDFTMTDLAKGCRTSMRSIKNKGQSAYDAVRVRVGDADREQA